MWYIDIFFLLAVIYLFVIKEYLYQRKPFKCLRCGDCCKLKVKINKDDEKRLKKNGYNNFLDEKRFLKKINGNCIFIGMKNGFAFCQIDKIKPEICRNFPEKKGLFGKKRDHRCRSCWQEK
jgi:Fe-S-cluster containining protein